MARRVWTHDFAVPEMVLVKAVVYLICKNMAVLIKNPATPVRVIKNQNPKSHKKYTSRLISPTSPEKRTMGVKRTIEMAVL